MGRWGVGVNEGGLAPHDGHVVAPQLILDDVLLAPEDFVDLGEELFRGRASVGRRRARTVVPPGDTREEQHRLAESLAGDRARAETDPAEALLLLDHGDALSELRRLHRRPLAGGAAADAHEVVVVSPRHL